MNLAAKWTVLKHKKIDRKDAIIAILVLCIIAMLFFSWYYFRAKKNPFAGNYASAESGYHYLFSIYEPEHLRRPLGVAVTEYGEIIVTDSFKHRLVFFDRNGKLQKTLGSAGKAPGQFNYPSSVAVSGQKLYVADLYNQRVQVLNMNGKQLSVIPAGRDRQQLGGTIMPACVAVDQRGNIFVSDISSQRILAFDSSGSYLHAFGRAGSQPGEFSYVNGITIDQNGTIYLANSNNSSLEVYSAEGKYLKTLGKGKLTNPRGLAFNTRKQLVYVADTLAHKVVGINASGNIMESLGERGVGTGKFNFPNTVAFDEEGRLYIADRENNRVEVYSQE